MKLKHVLTSVAVLSASFVFAQAQDDVLLTIEGKDITVSEFMAIYNKNNVEIESADKKSVEDYMDLYLNFKLKVHDAEVQGYDTAAGFTSELNGYVNQLAEPYLVDNQFTEDLIKQAYDRLQWEINAKHIMVKIPDNASPEDTALAWVKINEIYKKTQAEGAKFSDLAVEFSDDPSVVKNGGDLGYFSAFRMVYNFENAVYNTPVGSVSTPIRTSFGYHVLKVIDKRPARGEMKAAHIMIISNDKSTAVEKAKAKRKITEIYGKLQNGDDFAKLASTFSDDRGSAQKGGDLGWFGAGRMVPEFEDNAFALAANGDYSEPFLTQFGWHIVLRKDKRNLGSFEKEYDDIAKKVKQDRRSLGSQHALVLQLIKDYNIKINTKGKLPYYSVVDSSYFEKSWNDSLASGLNKTLITIKDKKYGEGKVTFTQKDFTEFLVSKMRKQKPMAIPMLVDKEFDLFVDEMIISYEKSVLSKKHPEYKALVTEYHDGILLFEIMEKEVWKRAISDSVGLTQFFEENQKDYMWEERLDAKFYICNSQEIANEVKKMVVENKTDSFIVATVNSKSELAVTPRAGKFSKGKEPYLENVKWAEGIYSTVSGKEYIVVKVNEILAVQPKQLDEVRGLVTSAYQDELDEKWVKELREKYSYTINKEALTTIAK